MKSWRGNVAGSPCARRLPASSHSSASSTLRHSMKPYDSPCCPTIVSAPPVIPSRSQSTSIHSSAGIVFHGFARYMAAAAANRRAHVSGETSGSSVISATYAPSDSSSSRASEMSPRTTSSPGTPRSSAASRSSATRTRSGRLGSPALGSIVACSSSSAAPEKLASVTRMSITRSVAGSYHASTAGPFGVPTTAAIHSRAMCPTITSGGFAVALLVLLTAPARTRFIAADLRRRDDRSLPLAGAHARDRGVERFDHDLGRLDDRRRGIGGHRGLLDVLGEQLGELGVDVRLLRDQRRRDALVHRLVGEAFDLAELLGDDLVGIGEVLRGEVRQRAGAVLAAIEHRPHERREEHGGLTDRIAVLAENGGGVLEQERLHLQEALGENVHRLLVALLIEAGEGADGLLDGVGRNEHVGGSSPADGKRQGGVAWSISARSCQCTRPGWGTRAGTARHRQPRPAHRSTRPVRA